MLPKGILLNTKADRFDTMVIGWGALGANWGTPCFTAYIRQSRYTLEQLTKHPYFTLSIPLTAPDPEVTKICGGESGRTVDKVKKLGFTLEEARKNGVPGIREYPLTLECKVLYRQDQNPAVMPEEVLTPWYPADSDGKRDIHTTFIGQILDAYLIR